MFKILIYETEKHEIYVGPQDQDPHEVEVEGPRPQDQDPHDRMSMRWR
jgi:hypothetical protein